MGSIGSIPSVINYIYIEYFRTSIYLTATAVRAGERMSDTYVR